EQAAGAGAQLEDARLIGQHGGKLPRQAAAARPSVEALAHVQPFGAEGLHDTTLRPWGRRGWRNWGKLRRGGDFPHLTPTLSAPGGGEGVSIPIHSRHRT